MWQPTLPPFGSMASCFFRADSLLFASCVIYMVHRYYAGERDSTSNASLECNIPSLWHPHYSREVKLRRQDRFDYAQPKSEAAKLCARHSSPSPAAKYCMNCPVAAITMYSADHRCGNPLVCAG
ncbi:hypothetical protein HBI56_113270 [Parastagonospora nodorum]|nr:hypothetical protein HBH52_116980 [Parastagonospora nodorum]KAH4036415.1 hypothetical protein HBI09_072690 [Parastagonospora nodorum]KAH4067961.1 hypothetical protein HBH50_120830 [Parastagonospora nodorum]KAH4085804.1 hypothetical protein HBH48_154340 [Parastagonospora nodorum]KAH4342492.1 hypothetical protein HBH98_158780 [Parastagonospora nodorum]